MILTKKEINDLTPNLGDLWRIKSSHFKAIDRIKELEAQSQDWHERYVICCEDSKLEKEALQNELIEANARIRELEANIDRWFRDHQKLSEAFIRQCDRADRAEAELMELKSSPDNFYELYKQEQARAEDYKAKLQKLVKATEWRDELVCFYTTPRTDKPRNKNGWWDSFDYENCRKADAEAAYQVALKAAKGGIMNIMQAVDERMTRLENENRKFRSKLRELVEAASAVDQFFQSGNNIPVERATIPADVWGPVQAALKAAKSNI